jgi:pimeloyl-ACP methyl ester carboxylesterase
VRGGSLPPQERLRLVLEVCEWGQRHEGLPLVILHGYLEQAAAWGRVAPLLGRRVLAPDHRGHGRSEHVGVGGFYHFWDYVGDLDGFIESIGGPVDLVGHSMGGTIACLYAGCRPEQVRRLVLVEGLGPPDGAAEAVTRARRFLADLRDPPRHRTMVDADEAARRMREWNPALGADEVRELARRTVVPSPSGSGVVWSWDARHRMRAPVPFQSALFLKFLAEINAPTLAIDGASSPFAAADLAERRAAIRSCRHVVMPGGHLLHHEDPVTLAGHIRSFLEEA